MAKIIDGNLVSAKINDESTRQVAELVQQHQIQPGLAVVLIGDDPASQVYVGRKVKKCAELGIYSEKIVLNSNAEMPEVLALIDRLNKDPKIHGILVQSPPPPQIDETSVIAAINPSKDVDCFHPINVGKMLTGKTDGFFPCTPYGVMLLLQHYNINPAGLHTVIIGRSNIVGKPMLALLIQKGKGADATVTMVHSRTVNLEQYTKQADILIAAIGKPEFVTAAMVKPGAVVIDVGINRIADPSAKNGSRITGDVNFTAVEPIASFITPVPGGVGPMTIAVLMQNTIKACKAINGIA
jgi:methylenetetrahydrofolate dehydrogenase (NADP+)/methenyltetrahydrofolate cyclohydrolase